MIPFYGSAKPWIVFVMSCYDSLFDLNKLDLQTISNQMVQVLSKVSLQTFQVMLFSLSNIMAWLFSLSNFAFNVFFYFTVVIFFLNDGNDLVE
jgi:predicted PurR-regulated permease PerM